MSSLLRHEGGEAEVKLRRFQGPGESVDMRGLGNGVTSPMALMTGLERLLLEPLDEAIAPVRAALRLGGRASWTELAEVVLFKGFRLGERLRVFGVMRSR